MSGPTIRQRQVLDRLATAPTAAQRAAMARDFAARHPHHAISQYELGRSEQHAIDLRADALQARVAAAGEVGCAEVAEQPLTMRQVIEITATGFLAVAAMLAFGWLFREPMARVLIALGVL